MRPEWSTMETKCNWSFFFFFFKKIVENVDFDNILHVHWKRWSVPFHSFQHLQSYINVNENVTLSSKKCHDKSFFFQGRGKNTILCKLIGISAFFFFKLWYLEKGYLYKENIKISCFNFETT